MRTTDTTEVSASGIIRVLTVEENLPCGDVGWVRLVQEVEIRESQKRWDIGVVHDIPPTKTVRFVRKYVVDNLEIAGLASATLSRLRYTDRAVPDSRRNLGTPLARRGAQVGEHACIVEDTRKPGQLDAEHSIHRSQKRVCPQVVAWAMMRANQASERLRFTIAMVVDRWTQRAGRAGPVVVGHEVEVFVKGRLRLLFHHGEDLVDGSTPITVHEARIFCCIIIAAREFQEAAQRVELVLALEDRLVIHRSRYSSVSPWSERN